MSMTISTMTSDVINSGQLGGKASVAGSDPVAQALDRAGKRIEQQRASADVQVSAFGKIKSGFADVQAAGHALANPGKAATTADIIKAAQSFVSAVNTTTNAVSSATAKSGALAGDGRAFVAGNDLARSLTSGSSTADLKKIGITTNRDGTLSVDTKALNTALKNNPNAAKDTLAKVGGQAEKAASRELAGNVGDAVNTLTARAKSLATQQTAQSATSASLSANISNFAASGIAAYLSVFSI